jgi:hypothetical protein
MGCNTCCNCDSGSSNGGSTTTVNELCCTIKPPLPTVGTTIPIQWHLEVTPSPSGGQQVPAYEAGVTSAGLIAPNASQRFWLYQYSINVATTQQIQLYSGDAAGDYAIIGRMLANATVSDNGGLIATVPVVPFGLGRQLYARGVGGAGIFHVVAYGILETPV